MRKLFLLAAVALGTTSYTYAQPGIEEEEALLCVGREVVTCDALVHPRCNTIIPGAIPHWDVDMGPAGGSTTIVCASFTYNNCPTGEMQSTALDRTPEWITSGQPFNQQGAGYVVTSVPDPKICSRDEPCRLTPEISTILDPNDCYNCQVEWPNGQLNPAFPEDAHGSTCSYIHWCVGTQDPPGPVTVEHKLIYQILELNAECVTLYGTLPNGPSPLGP